MANYYKVSPENLQELMTDHIREVIDQLDKGHPVLITPEKWAGNQNETASEEEECNCPACASKRDAMKHFAGKYSEEQLEKFFDSGEFPDEVSSYLESRIEIYLTEAIDEVLGDELKTFPKERLVHISELVNLPSIPRYEIKPITVDYHSSKSLPKDHLIVSKAPAFIKMIKPECPDYMIIGNLETEAATNLRKSTESYRYNQALIMKIGDKVMSAEQPSSFGLADLLEALMN